MRCLYRLYVRWLLPVKRDMALRNEQKGVFISVEIQHVYTARSRGNVKILTDTIKFIHAFTNVLPSTYFVVS